ncbi:helix-turn-helix transcriptional regulator [Rhizophagus clarus]|nr:helix-turn-helix transcriptional regulator [Rhizophagus clarus]
MSRTIYFLFRLFIFLNCIFQVFGQVSNNLPVGWFSAGDSQQEYQMGIDYTTFYGKAPSGFIKSLPNVNESGFGTLMQNFFPKDYLGKHVRFSCAIKYNNVLNWAGMWVRVDSVNGGLDNMYGRRITGTGDWKVVENIVNVPGDTNVFAFGILLSGEGEVWIDECNFELAEYVPSPTFYSNPNADNFGMLTYTTSFGSVYQLN